jgi:large repetitive protein
MKISKYLFHFMFPAIITIIAGCGDTDLDYDPPSSRVTITTSSSLPPITVNTASPAMPLVASGGTAPYKWSLTQGSSLPPGLSLSSDGVISGTPTMAGTYNFSIIVTDSAIPTNTATQSFSLTINLDITTPAALPSVTANTPLTPVTLTATGGTAPYIWTLTPGSTLPAGLSLSTAGVISGSPTTAGTYNFGITVTDSATPAGSAIKVFSIIVATPATP